MSTKPPAPRRVCIGVRAGGTQRTISLEAGRSGRAQPENLASRSTLRPFRSRRQRYNADAEGLLEDGTRR
jgi:hypothetical protein